MKRSKSPLQQIPSYLMFSGFLILFAYGTFGQDTATKPTTEAATTSAANSVSVTSSNVTVHTSTFPTKKLTTKGADVVISSKTHPVSKSLVATSSNKKTSVSTLPRKHPSTSISDTTIKRSKPVTLKQTKPVDTTTGIPTTAKQETTTTVATTPDKIETTKLVGKPRPTVGESTTLSTTAATVESPGLKPRSTKQEKGTPEQHVQDDSTTPVDSTTPGRHVQADSTTPGRHVQADSTTPGQHVQGDSTAHDISSRAPEIQYTTGASTPEPPEDDFGTKNDTAKDNGGGTVTPTTKAPHSDPRTTASPPKDSRAMTVAIVLSILLLMVLLIALLACWRRRRHSGSTSFKTAGWAGQAALPDDSGLDKDVEQEALTTGERETRRATLTTFFGKRQSRVPSVAMEEVVQKETGNAEEAQHLISGDLSSISSLERSGEANGKLPEHTVECSQGKEFPLPPANQEATPPTPPE